MAESRRKVAAAVKEMLAQRLLRETAAGPSLYDSLYVRLTAECDRWAGEKA